MNKCVGWLVYRSKSLEALIEGRPVILVHNGRVDHKAMRKTQMTIHELESSIRSQGCTGPEEVRFAVLENNGHITVIKEKHRWVDS